MRVLSLILTSVLVFCAPANNSDDQEAASAFSGALAYLAYPYLIEPCAVTRAEHTGPIAPITSGYGARGERQIAVTRLANPSADRAVCVYYPRDLTEKAPTLFLLHGFGSPSAEVYMELIDFAVSRGLAVVMPIYFSDDRPVPENYAIMKAGLEFAVSEFSSLIDTARVGYWGHSYGGGSVPYLAREGLIKKGWGSAGTFLYMAAPWYSFAMDNAALAEFSSTNAKLLMQVYEEDDVTDHRMAKDIFENIGIPAAEKDYVQLFSDTHDGYKLFADHYTPTKAIIIGGGALDGLDFYGIFRPLDALADYSFNGSAAGKSVALGGGSAAQRFMGAYPDGSPVKELEATDTPVVTKPESYYSAKWSNAYNPRR